MISLGRRLAAADGYCTSCYAWHCTCQSSVLPSPSRSEHCRTITHSTVNESWFTLHLLSIWKTSRKSFKTFKPVKWRITLGLHPFRSQIFDPRWYVLGRVIGHKGIASCSTLATSQGLHEKDSCTGNPGPNMATHLSCVQMFERKHDKLRFATERLSVGSST